MPRVRIPIGLLLVDSLSSPVLFFLQMRTASTLPSTELVRIRVVVLGPMGRQSCRDAFSHTEGSARSWWKNSSSLGD